MAREYGGDGRHWQRQGPAKSGSGAGLQTDVIGKPQKRKKMSIAERRDSAIKKIK